MIVRLYFKQPLDPQTTPLAISNEPIEIRGGVAILQGCPQDVTGFTVLVGGNARTVVTSAPAVGQVRVKTYNGLPLPILEFNSADEGLFGSFSGNVTGTILTSLFFACLKEFLQPLQTSYTTIADLQAAIPAQTDIAVRGYPGDKAMLSDGSEVRSTGTGWVALGTGGGAGATQIIVDRVSPFSILGALARETAIPVAFDGVPVTQIMVDRAQVVAYIKTIIRDAAADVDYTVPAGGGTKTTINGYAGIGGAVGYNPETDTGTESGVTMAAGTILVDAAADAYLANPDENYVTVNLVVDGVIRDYVTAYTPANGTADDHKTKTLSYVVSAGVHTIRVYATYSAYDFSDWSAGNIRIPIP